MNSKLTSGLAASLMVLAGLSTAAPLLAQGHGGSQGQAAPQIPPGMGDRDQLRDRDQLHTPDQDRDRDRDQDWDQDRDRDRDQDRDRDGDRDQDRDRDRDRLQIDRVIVGQASSWQLLTSEERAQFHNRMQAARTEEERNRIRNEAQATIRDRARHLGVDAPFGPDRSDYGARAGYALAQMLTEQERLQFHQRMRNAASEEERNRIRNEMQVTARERAREMGIDVPEWFGAGPNRN